MPGWTHPFDFASELPPELLQRRRCILIRARRGREYAPGPIEQIIPGKLHYGVAGAIKRFIDLGLYPVEGARVRRTDITH